MYTFYAHFHVGYTLHAYFHFIHDHNDEAFAFHWLSLGCIHSIIITLSDLFHLIYLEDPEEQLRLAMVAVFESWNSPRAIKYRAINQITGLKGTAVNIQTMVFGNMGTTSGTGVLFTRNPSTGERKLYGEFLINAQVELLSSCSIIIYAFRFCGKLFHFFLSFCRVKMLSLASERHWILML